MSHHTREAPIFADSLCVAEWILHHTNEHQDALSLTMSASAIQLVELVALALSGREKLERLHAIDDLLIRLRMHTRLAISLQRFNDRQALYLINQLDQIGQQLGGWLRRMRHPSRRTRRTQVSSSR